METNQDELKKGDDVLWLDNPFTIVDIKGNKALLKQRFSIGINLADYVPLNEIFLETSVKSKEREERLGKLLRG